MHLVPSSGGDSDEDYAFEVQRTDTVDDIVYIAEELGKAKGATRGRHRRWLFAGADHSSRHGETLQELAAQRGVTVDFVTCNDLRKEGNAEHMLDVLEKQAGGRVSMVMMSRFLDRGLLARVAHRLRKRAPRSAVLVLSQFESLPRCLAFGHPRRDRDVLRDKEMDAMIHAWNSADDADFKNGDALAVEGGEKIRTQRQTKDWSIVFNELMCVDDNSGRRTREFVAVAAASSPPHHCHSQRSVAV